MPNIMEVLGLFRDKFGVKPNALFLGIKEYHDLVDEGSKCGFNVREIILDEIERPEYCGCKVYRVNAHSHISCNKI